ncbi:hypothetical protein JCM21900_003419 [Sporobolomyces salmonicolor]
MLATRPICRKRFYLTTAAQSCRSFAFRPTPPSPSLRDWLRTSAWVNSVTDKIPYRIIRKSDVELGIDDEFNRLPALEQIWRAMHGPVPTELPQLRNDRLEALLFKGKDLWPLSEREERDFREAYHRERLEFVGDRIWEEVVVLVLFSLAPIQRLPTKTAAPSLGHFQNETSRLTTNEMAARLAREFKLDQRLRTTAIADLADGWEAYLTALFFSNGRRAVLEFLAPIIKREFFEVHRPSDALPPLVFERLSTSPSRPLLTGLFAIPVNPVSGSSPLYRQASSSGAELNNHCLASEATADSDSLLTSHGKGAIAVSLRFNAPLRFRTIVEAASNLLAELDRQKIPRLDTASSDAPSDTSPATASSTSPSEPSSSSAFTLAATTSSSSPAPSACAPLPGHAEALLLSEAPPPAPSPVDEPSHSFSFSDERGEPVEEISTPEAGSALTSVVSPDTEVVPSPTADEASHSFSLSDELGEPTGEMSAPDSDSALPSVVSPVTEDGSSPSAAPPPLIFTTASPSSSDAPVSPSPSPVDMPAPDSDSALPSVVSPVTEDGSSPSAAPPPLIFTTASPSSSDAPVSPSPSPVDQPSDPSSSLSASDELQTATTDEKVAVDLGDDALEHEHVEVVGSPKTTAMDEPEQAVVDSEGVASDGPPAIAVTVQGGAQSSDGAVAIEPIEEEVAKEEKDDRKQEGPDGGQEDDEKKP